MSDLTQEYLKTRLDYSPFLGIFWWLPRPVKTRGDKMFNARFAEKQAGCLNGEGYLTLRIDGRLYRAHRLAWLYMTGRWPQAEIDHINGRRDDNRWQNLREATRSENGRNCCLYSNNTSGVRGIVWHKQCKKWYARIEVNGRRISLGVFADKAPAIAARQAAEKRYFGAFAPQIGAKVIDKDGLKPTDQADQMDLFG